MVRLALHGTHATVGKEEPLELFGIEAGLLDGVKAQRAVLVEGSSQVEQDGRRLKRVEWSALGSLVHDGWDTSVGVDLSQRQVLKKRSAKPRVAHIMQKNAPRGTMET